MKGELKKDRRRVKFKKMGFSLLSRRKPGWIERSLDKEFKKK